MFVLNLLAAFLLLATPPAATPAPDASYRSTARGGIFDCDAPSGHFRRGQISAYADGNVMMARIRFREARPHPQWPTAAALFFLFEDQRTAGIMVHAPASFPDSLLVTAKLLEEPQRRQVIALVPRTEAIEVTTSLDDSGALTISAGGRTQVVNIGEARPVGHAAHCQSGRYEIDLRGSYRRERR